MKSIVEEDIHLLLRNCKLNKKIEKMFLQYRDSSQKRSKNYRRCNQEEKGFPPHKSVKIWTRLPKESLKK
jgi:hypothetical protein